MVEANTRLVEPTQGIDESGSVEQAVSFRFRVTWTSVFGAFETPNAAAPAVAHTHERVPTLITAPAEGLLEPPPNLLNGRISGTEPVLRGQKTVPPSTGVQWEMVVPRMVRPSAKTSRASEISAAPSRSRSVLQPLPERTGDASPENPGAQPRSIAPTAEQAGPNFSSLSPPLFERVRLTSLGFKLLLAAAALAGLAVPVWRHFGSGKPAAAEIQTTTRAGGWARQPATRVDAGFNHARELVVYRPSLKATDCRFEFNWRVDTPSVGWVFRAKDTANYYAMRIKVLRQGPSPTISVEHFVVYAGVEGTHSEKVLVLSRNDPVLHIRTEITGPSFTVYIGETAAEYWTDTKLAAGGLGFFQEWHQGSDVEWVRMSFAPGTEIQRDGLRLYTYALSGGD